MQARVYLLSLQLLLLKRGNSTGPSTRRNIPPFVAPKDADGRPYTAHLIYRRPQRIKEGLLTKTRCALPDLQQAAQHRQHRPTPHRSSTLTAVTAVRAYRSLQVEFPAPSCCADPTPETPPGYLALRAANVHEQQVSFQFVTQLRDD